LIDEQYVDVIAKNYGDLYGKGWTGEDYRQETHRIAILREALGIPIDKSIRIVVGD
jgi:hypothetical protein